MIPGVPKKWQRNTNVFISTKIRATREIPPPLDGSEMRIRETAVQQGAEPKDKRLVRRKKREKKGGERGRRKRVGKFILRAGFEGLIKGKRANHRQNPIWSPACY